MLKSTTNPPRSGNRAQSPSFKPSFFVILLQLVPLYGRREREEEGGKGGREERVLASVGNFANLMQQNVRASERGSGGRREGGMGMVSIDCYGRISLKKVGSAAARAAAF